MGIWLAISRIRLSLISCAKYTLQQKYLLFQPGGQHLIWLISMKIIYCLMIFPYLVPMMIQYLEIQRDIKVKLLLIQER